MAIYLQHQNLTYNKIHINLLSQQSAHHPATMDSGYQILEMVDGYRLLGSLFSRLSTLYLAVQSRIRSHDFDPNSIHNPVTEVSVTHGHG